jgi:hypothetical protein
MNQNSENKKSAYIGKMVTFFNSSLEQEIYSSPSSILLKVTGAERGGGGQVANSLK